MSTPNGNGATGNGVHVRVLGVPMIGDIEVRLSLIETGTQRVDFLKRKVMEQLADAGVQQIPLSDWGFWSPRRAIPFNMPLSHLCQMDAPLRFSWHEWTDSYQNRRAWLPHDLYR